MATTEGCLVASTSRGCKAISAGGGAKTELLNDGMSRGPVVSFSSIVQAAQMKRWIDDEGGFDILKSSFESTSRFAKLNKVKRIYVFLIFSDQSVFGWKVSLSAIRHKNWRRYGNEYDI